MGTQLGNTEHIFRSKYGSVSIPDDVTLPEFVLQDAELYAEKVAFVEAVTGKEYTYAQVARDTRRFSKALVSIGIRKGHVVVVVLPNVAEYAIVALGIMAAGAVFSGANPSAHTMEIKKQAEAAEAKLVVTNGAIYNKVKDLGLPVIVLGEEKVPTAMNWEALLEASEKASTRETTKVKQTDLCALPFSSGTTGVSKGVMLTHRNLVANLSSTLYGVERDMIGKVTTLGLMPFFHIYGISGICCATLRNKGKVVVMSRFDLRTFLGALITHEITFAPLVPPILLQLVKSPVVDEFDLSRLSLQAVMTAAAPLAPELLNAFETKFPGVQVQEAYGLTEHSCITLTHSSRQAPPAKRNSVGHILPNIELKFVDPDDPGRSFPANTPGELCVRSQCVMQGYYNNQHETDHTIDHQGWLHTGDVGYIDDDGNVFVVDRIKELIKYKGFQVAPAELEAVLLANPLIEDVAVIPLPDEEAGEIPAACVVMSERARETTREEDIMEFVSLHVASYKRVREVHFMDSIPKSASGKIMRRLLKDTILNKKKNNNDNTMLNLPSTS